MSTNYADVDQMFGDLGLDDPSLTGWDGAKRELIPPGEYVLEVVSCKLGQSKKGNNTIEVEWKVVSEGDAFGKTFRQWYGTGQTGNPKSDQISKRRLKHVFVDSLGVTIVPGGGFSSGDTIGRRLIGEITHESRVEFSPTANREVEYVNERLAGERPVEDGAEDVQPEPEPEPEPKPAPTPAATKAANGKARQAVGPARQASK